MGWLENYPVMSDREFEVGSPGARSVSVFKHPGGRPGAGYLLLRGQKKLTEEKAALVSLRLRVPCVTQRVRGLRNSLSNSERTHKNVRELGQSSPTAPNSSALLGGPQGSIS